MRGASATGCSGNRMSSNAFVLIASAKLGDVHSALYADHSAHTIQRESKPQLNRRHLGIQQKQERPSLVTIGEHADRFDDDFAELELERAAEFAIQGVRVQIPAARRDPGVERQSNAARSLEAEVNVEWP